MSGTCDSRCAHIIRVHKGAEKLVVHAHGGARHDDQAHARHKRQLRAGAAGDRLEVFRRSALGCCPLPAAAAALTVHPLRP